MNGAVNALAVLPNGELVAGGSFTSAGGTIANCIAKWTGSTWTSFGTGMNAGGTVYALAVHPNGDLIAGGAFTSVNGTSANRIARWDGMTWTAMGSGMTGGIAGTTVRSIAFLSNGDIVASGGFANAGEDPASNIARWNGSDWAALGAGTNGTVSACIVLPTGDLIAGGHFSVPASNVAKWNGSQWLPVGEGTNGGVTCLSILSNGKLVAAGAFTTAGGAGNTVGYIAQWDGTAWAPVGSGMLVGLGGTRVNALKTMPDGALIVGGSCTTASPVPSSYIASFDGQDWIPVGVGMTVGKIVQQVNCVAALPGGGVVAGGTFTHAGRESALHIAQWDTRDWKAMGAGMTGGSPSTSVVAVAVLPNGDVVAGGRFSTAGSAAVNNIARWNGSTWLPVDQGLNDTVLSLAVTSDGELIAGGFFTASGAIELNRIARWNGVAWTPLGTGLSGTTEAAQASVGSIAVSPNGDIIAGGDFFFSGGTPVNRLARWNGSQWSALGDGFTASGSVVSEVITLLNGDVIVGGDFSFAGPTPVSNIARWDGTSWSALGKGLDGSVYGLALMADGGIAAGGRFTGSGMVNPVPVSRVARWDGSSWLAMGTGMTGSIQDIRVTTLAILTNGELAAGGNFLYADGKLSAGVSRWSIDPSPRIAIKPLESTIEAGEQLIVHAAPASGYTNVSFQWQRNGVDIVDGPGGASTDGGTVLGSSGVLNSPTAGRPLILTVTGAQTSDTGEYSVVLMNSCGSSNSAALQVVRGCAADLNGDNLVDDADFVFFVGAYTILDCSDAAMPAGCPADLDGSGLVNDFDFVMFVMEYNQLICD